MVVMCQDGGGRVPRRGRSAAVAHVGEASARHTRGAIGAPPASRALRCRTQRRQQEAIRTQVRSLDYNILTSLLVRFVVVLLSASRVVRFPPESWCIYYLYLCRYIIINDTLMIKETLLVSFLEHLSYNHWHCITKRVKKKQM